MDRQDIHDIITHQHMASIKPSGDQKQIDADKEAFFAKGGKITVVEAGQCNADLYLNQNSKEHHDRQRATMGAMFNKSRK